MLGDATAACLSERWMSVIVIHRHSYWKSEGKN